MTLRLRLLILAVVVAVLYLSAVPIVGYVLNHNEETRTHSLVLRFGADEAQTAKLSQQNAALIARLTADEAKLAENTAATKKQTCLSGNDYRMQDLALWHFIFTAFPNPNPTPEMAVAANRFLAFLAVHDKQRSC